MIFVNGIPYPVDGLDDLEVGGEDDDQWEDEPQEVDVRDIRQLKKYILYCLIETYLTENHNLL